MIYKIDLTNKICDFFYASKNEVYYLLQLSDVVNILNSDQYDNWNIYEYEIEIFNVFVNIKPTVFIQKKTKNNKIKLIQQKIVFCNCSINKIYHQGLYDIYKNCVMH